MASRTALSTAPPLPLAYASLAASMLLVGSYVGLSRLLVAALPVLLLAWLRFAIAAVAMLRWHVPRPGDAALTRRDHVLLFWQSLLGNFLFSICMLYGVKLTSALAAGVTMAALPAAVALLSWALLRERIGVRTGVGIVCAATAIALLAVLRTAGGDGAPAEAGSPGGPGDAGVLLGYALLVAAVFCEASYVVIGKRLTASVSPRRIAAMINLWGLALVTPLGLWAAWSFDFRAVPGALWLLLVFYALAASVWAVWLWMFGLRQVPAPKAGIFTVMLPVGAALVGVLWLGEPFGTGHALAFALAVTGLVLAVWPGSRRAADALPPPVSGSSNH